MTDNEIIKALENEIRSTEYVDSNYCDSVDLTLIKSAVALINCQKAEIERYERESNSKFDKWKLLDDRTKQRYAELYEEAKSVVRAEAYKEFAEKLKKRFYLIAGRCVVNVYHIDNLLKEMIDKESEVK